MKKSNTDLFLLTRKGGCGYDEMNAILIRATTSQEARGIAAAHHVDEGASVWLNPKLTKCRRIKYEGNIGMIIQDRRDG